MIYGSDEAPDAKCTLKVRSLPVDNSIPPCSLHRVCLCFGWGPNQFEQSNQMCHCWKQDACSKRPLQPLRNRLPAVLPYGTHELNLQSSARRTRTSRCCSPWPAWTA